MFIKKNKGVSLSKEHNPNYLAKVCMIDNISPVENADRLMKTTINGYDIIVDNSYKIGDIVIHFTSETVICKDFLSKNNLYGWDNWEENDISDLIRLLLCYSEDEKSDEEMKKAYKDKARSLCGFFNKSGRVKTIRLRGQISNGFIVKYNIMDDYIGKKMPWDIMIGKTFDTVNGKLFCWKYIPPVKELFIKSNVSRWNKLMKRINRHTNRLIPGQFELHYFTKKLNDEITYFKPDDEVSITVKCHGTSGVFSNVLWKKEMPWYKKILTKIGVMYNDKEYKDLYASRSVIKNREINTNANDYYGTDIWGDVNEAIKSHISKGMTVYGEIVGYITGTEKMIQIGHDYGCKVGQWKFMPYRITQTDKFGNKTEWDVDKVNEWTNNLIKKGVYISDRLMPMEILYIGKLGDLYPDLDTNNHWHENIFERLKNDKNFLMEEPEPMCKLNRDKYESVIKKYKDVSPDNVDAFEKAQKKINDAKSMLAPREGIVIRKINDNKPCAFKLKTDAHYLLETKQHDKGEISIDEIE